ncbi:hypothetical protein [Modestobacter marinus]|uniref:hypothetical protein n=1 Tax=Modestobacter marinus TaxID=477641 RepID=UPI001C95A4FB|nr:hypothetical protein [Modestobacter marinus]
MSEQSNQPDRPAEEESTHASTGADVNRPEGGVTEGETTVDEAIGSGEDPTR